MTSRTPRNQNWLPYLGLITLAAGIVFQSGVLSNRVDQLTDRIVKLEAIQAQNKDALEQMNLRGARNETKLDFLVDQETKDRRR
jgi:hypothetical protein